MKLDVLCENLLPQFIKFREEGDYVRANQLLVSVYWYEVKGAMRKDPQLGIRIATGLEYPLVECHPWSSEVGYKKKVENTEDRFF